MQSVLAVDLVGRTVALSVARQPNRACCKTCQVAHSRQCLHNPSNRCYERSISQPAPHTDITALPRCDADRSSETHSEG